MNDNPQDHELRDRVIFYLKKRHYETPLRIIAAESGLKERWIRSVLTNGNDPSAGKLTVLYKYLAKVESLNLS